MLFCQQRNALPQKNNGHHLSALSLGNQLIFCVETSDRGTPKLSRVSEATKFNKDTRYMVLFSSSGKT